MLTIIIPTYNRRQDVLEMIASIKKSDYHDFQLVVVDDGSRDKTKEAIEKEYKEIIVLRQLKNMGAAAARNLGIKKFIDQADYFLFYIFKSVQFRDLKALKAFWRGMAHGFSWVLNNKK